MDNDQLNKLRQMAELAVELCQDLDGRGAEEGYFRIPQDEGNKLASTCYDMLRRVDELLDGLSQG